MKGTYLLILRLNTDVADLRVGRLGRLSFAAGYYLYVGSALGPGGLDARLAHHARRAHPRPHWHLDYLRPHARLLEAWTLACDTSLERLLVDALAAAGMSAAAPGFGASDSDRGSHLLFSASPPAARAITAAILAAAEAAGEPQLAVEIHTYDET